MIVEQLGVTGSGGITTAGCQNEEVESQEQEEKLPIGDITLFRGVAARANYLGPDRPNMLYASKEVCREMSSPWVGGWTGENYEDWQIPCWKTPGSLGVP